MIKMTIKHLMIMIQEVMIIKLGTNLKQTNLHLIILLKILHKHKKIQMIVMKLLLIQSQQLMALKQTNKILMNKEMILMFLQMINKM